MLLSGPSIPRGYRTASSASLQNSQGGARRHVLDYALVEVVPTFCRSVEVRRYEKLIEVPLKTGNHAVVCSV